MVTSSRTYQDEGGSLGSGPMVQHDYTYDDYTTINGLGSYGCPLGNGQNDGSHYNNLCQENTEGSNLPNSPNPFVSQLWTYQPADTTVSGWVYYNVKLAAHSEIDDSSGNISDCQSFKYDQNRNSGVPTPAAGFLTTVNWYQQSACTPANFGTAQITTYAGYDLDGNQPLVQNTYDTNILGTQGTDDFPVGRLTKSVATTYSPEGTSLTTTEKWQYDTRVRVTTAQLKFSLPASWNVTNALPTYQETLSYTDADQLETTTTSILNQSGQGYRFSQIYDQTLGLLTGLSTGSTSSANLAWLNYNINDLLSKIYYQTSTGSNLAYAQLTYDGDLRPQEERYTWQGGSGQSGQFFDQARSYDAASNVTGASTSIGASSESANYCYDEQDRLVWAGNSGTQPGAGSGTCGSLTLSNSFPGANYSNTFSYTNLGQLWHAPLNGSGGYQQYLYCTGNSHQLQGVYSPGATCANPGTANYSVHYDAWGNVSSRTYNSQTATLSYNPLDQLVEWQVPNTNAAWYGYDSSGERSLQRSTVGSTTSLTVYAFGLEEYHYDGSGNLQSSTHYYTLAGRLLGELQVNGSTATTTFFLSDGLGSVLGVFSNAANSASLLASQLYAPYGASHYGTHASDNRVPTNVIQNPPMLWDM